MAAALQRRLAPRVRLRPGPVPDLAIGLDASYGRGDRVGWAAAVAVRRVGLVPVAVAAVRGPIRFPYVPGLLSFREAPLLLAAYRRLRLRGGEALALFVDGQGLAHPRRFGLACHLGILLDLPAVGVAKSLLVPLRAGRRRLGAAVRLRRGARPVYVSPGHRHDVRSAARCVRAFSAGFRLPEPTRLAHIAVGAARRGEDPAAAIARASAPRASAR